MNISEIRNFLKITMPSCPSIEKNLRYLFISGSSLYGEDNEDSDIDLNLVFYDNFFEDKSSAMYDIKRFIEHVYVPLHTFARRKVDNVFPGEYISHSQIIASTKGAGFSASFNKLFLPEVSEGYWESDERTWYRAWAGALAFSLPLFDDKLYLYDKSQAQLLSIVYFLQDDVSSGKALTSVDNIISKISGYDSKQVSPLGITKKYERFHDVHSASIKSTMLNNSHIFRQVGNDEFMVNAGQYSQLLAVTIAYSKSFNVGNISADCKLSEKEVYELSL